MNNIKSVFAFSLLLSYLFVGLISCQFSAKSVLVKIENTLEIIRPYEIVEISMVDIKDALGLKETDSVVVLNEKDEEIPYQVTYDNKLIFPVEITALSTVCYKIMVGQPQATPTIACGKYYPERLDDISWENDVTAFRAYGPGSKERGYKLHGYDVFTKNNTHLPVVEERYALDLNPELRAKIVELRKSNPEAADELARAISYHVDHGNGMDCYAVGATLGGGATALLIDEELIYPGYYQNYKILDNGPLRFTLQLTFAPIEVGRDEAVIEHRLITLDSGSYLNKTEITYQGISQNSLLATGIVLHDRKDNVVCNTTCGYISYVDPTEGSDNGVMFMGAVFPSQLEKAEIRYFDEHEKKLRDDAEGHLLGISSYLPFTTYTYYWGSAWDKGLISTFPMWNNYLSAYYTRLLNPLSIKLSI